MTSLNSLWELSGGKTLLLAASFRPAIESAAVRSAVPLNAVLQLLGLQANTTHGLQLRGPARLTARLPAPVGAPPLSSTAYVPLLQISPIRELL